MNYPWIFIKPNGCEGNWDGGWTATLKDGGYLPAAADVVRAAGGHVASEHKLGVILEDALLHPLRLTLEEPAPHRERDRFLAWKLKRFLPFAVDTAMVRHLPLEEANTYLTFSLPRVWVARLVEGFEGDGRHCGYVGGAFTTLLENSTRFRGRKSIGLFTDFYVYAELDRAKRYLDYRLRRLPLTGESEEIDLNTLVESDWVPLLAGAEKPVQFCDLRNDPASEPAATLSRRGIALEVLPADGTPLERFSAWLGGVA